MIFVKKMILLAISAALLLSTAACGTTNDKSVVKSDITKSVSAAQDKTTVAEETAYEITIPYSYFSDGIPTDEDLVITGTDRTNGIIKKEKLVNGGMLITVDKSKYNDLLEYSKSKIIDYCNKQTEEPIYTNVEYNDDFNEFIIYQAVEKEETQPTVNDDDTPMAVIPDRTPPSISYENEITKESIYYQALIKMTDTEIITCKVKHLNSDTNELIKENTYPNE